MDIVDILKIVVPVIVALCGTVWATMRWTYDKQTESQQAYWKVVHEGLSKQILDHRDQYEAGLGSAVERVTVIEREFSDLRVKLAEEYIKREDWLEHAMGLERKVDQLRIDVSKELQALGIAVAKFGGQQ